MKKDYWQVWFSGGAFRKATEVVLKYVDLMPAHCCLKRKNVWTKKGKKLRYFL